MKPKILLVGYNGANNTGAEAKLLVCIDEIRSIMGPDAVITVPSLNETNLRRYLKEAPNLKIKTVNPAIFFYDVWRYVRQNDLIVLVEGSCYMDTWSSALLWGYLLATRYAHSMKKPCLAYSIDAGEASRFNRWLIRREASKTDLILARTQQAAERLRNWQVTAPIEVTADNAFAFNPKPQDQNLLKQTWPEASRVVGIAAEDIYLWPAQIRPFGPRASCYRWPYYYQHSKACQEKSGLLIDVLAVQADEIIEKYDKDIALLSMEGLDTAFTKRIQQHMKHADRTKVFSSINFNASQMTSVLRSLEMLITSRYHAGVLSLPSLVPQTAIGHDLRIKDLYADLEISELFVDHEDPNRYKKLSDNVETLFREYETIKAKLKKGYADYEAREKRNPQLLKAYIESNYPKWLN
ncbi:MAG: polysaccharide pyruvyl transferase family protein [Candidatus Bathyarchaeota archaeon]|nr:polysaccharide pyruvyl transferase family protein [Candidatus Bathyarchaeota archaeon]